MAAKKKRAAKAAKTRSGAVAARKAAKKAGAKKKPAAGKKAAAKAAPKKAAPKKAAPRKAATKKAPEKTPAKTPAKKRSGVSSLDVNLGHIFALRPRLATSFRPDDLRVARQLLQDESYKTIPEAARAVAERALDLTHDGPQSGTRRPGPGGNRW